MNKWITAIVVLLAVLSIQRWRPEWFDVIFWVLTALAVGLLIRRNIKTGQYW